MNLEESFKMNPLETKLLNNKIVIPILSAISLSTFVLKELEIISFTNEIFYFILFLSSITFVSILGGMIKIWTGLREYLIVNELKMTFHRATVNNAFNSFVLVLAVYSEIFTSNIAGFLSLIVLLLGFLSRFVIEANEE